MAEGEHKIESDFTEEQLMQLWYEQEVRERLMTEPGMISEIPEDYEVNETSVIAGEYNGVAAPVRAGML